jgi:hypothetical protein
MLVYKCGLLFLNFRLRHHGKNMRPQVSLDAKTGFFFCLKDKGRLKKDSNHPSLSPEARRVE